MRSLQIGDSATKNGIKHNQDNHNSDRRGVEWGYNDGNVMQFLMMEMMILTRRWTGLINDLIDLNTPYIPWFKVCRLYVAVLAHHSHHADLVLVSWTIEKAPTVSSASLVSTERRFLRVKH